MSSSLIYHTSNNSLKPADLALNFLEAQVLMLFNYIYMVESGITFVLQELIKALFGGIREVLQPENVTYINLVVMLIVVYYLHNTNKRRITDTDGELVELESESECEECKCECEYEYESDSESDSDTVQPAVAVECSPKPDADVQEKPATTEPVVSERFTDGVLTMRTITEGNVETIELYHPNGQLRSRYTLVDGIRNGLATDWHSNGYLEMRCTYVNDKFHGKVQRWHNNGKLANELIWENGKKMGIEEEWGSDGLLLTRTAWVADKKNGKEDKYWGGAWYQSNYYQDGQLVGRHTATGDNSVLENWSKTGQKSSSIHFKGKLSGDPIDGVAEYWHDNGLLRERSNYVDGQLDGIAEFWHDNGQLRKRCTFKSGSLVSTEGEWNPDGDLIVPAKTEVLAPTDLSSSVINSYLSLTKN